MQEQRINNDDYILLIQKTTELNVRVNNVETTIQNNAHQTQRALTELRDELIRTTAEVRSIMQRISDSAIDDRDQTDARIKAAIEENNILLQARFASSETLSNVSQKIDKLGTKMNIVGGVLFIVSAALIWILEHPQVLQIFR